MAAFKNTANGHTEYVGGGASAGVFFFGAIYLAIKGLWAHFFIWVVVVVGFTVLTGGPGLLIALPLASIIYALSIQGILESSYLKRGWVRVEPGSSGVSSTERACPSCAETIKSAAVKCRFCGEALDPQAYVAPSITSGWVLRVHCATEEELMAAKAAMVAMGIDCLPDGDLTAHGGYFASKAEAKVAERELSSRYPYETDIRLM